jgi:GNAT superfamily N-acetyltransferase
MMIEILYQPEPELTKAEFAGILDRSGLGKRRPVDQPETLEGMLRNADIIVTARTLERLLVGVARSISDFHFCTYLSDVAVDRAFQRQGIGRELIARSHQLAGRHTRLILLAAPSARDYYPHIGMVQHESCWQIPPINDEADPKGVLR